MLLVEWEAAPDVAKPQKIPVCSVYDSAVSNGERANLRVRNEVGRGSPCRIEQVDHSSCMICRCLQHLTDPARHPGPDVRCRRGKRQRVREDARIRADPQERKQGRVRESHCLIARKARLPPIPRPIMERTGGVTCIQQQIGVWNNHFRRRVRGLPVRNSLWLRSAKASDSSSSAS